jgi:hypothetical protein
MVARCCDGLTACNEAIDLRAENPDSPAAQWCLEQYFAELAARFEKGFDLVRSNSASTEEMTPPGAAGCALSRHELAAHQGRHAPARAALV